MKTIFVNAQEMAKLHPETFQAPTEEELNNIRVGDDVKVCANQSERFWVQITSIDGETITATVDNDLILTDKHGLRLGDIINFKKENIYSIY